MLDVTTFNYTPEDKTNNITRFDSVATKEELSLNMACYNGNDREYIEDVLDVKYLSGGKIPAIYVRFFKSFIDSQSNLYKNYFERVVNGDINMVDIDELNYALEEAEKIMHISGQSIMYVKSVSEFLVFDPSKFNKIDNNHYEIESDEGKIHVKNDGIYTETNNENGEIELYLVQPLSVLPIVEFFESKQAKYNTLCDLQYNLIADVSWGFHNATPKLLTQFNIQSETADDIIKDKTQHLGRTEMMIKMGVNDKIGVVEMGDLKNFVDIISIYNDIIKQQAVANGVNKNAINILTMFESGVSKIVELSYINEYRKQFFRIFKKAEKQLWNKISVLFGIKCEYVNLKFYPIQFSEVLPLDYTQSITMNETDYIKYKNDMKENNTNDVINDSTDNVDKPDI